MEDGDRTIVGVPECHAAPELKAALNRQPDLAVEVHEARLMILYGQFTVAKAFDYIREWGPITTQKVNETQVENTTLVQELEDCFETIQNGNCHIYNKNTY